MKKAVVKTKLTNIDFKQLQEVYLLKIFELALDEEVTDEQSDKMLQELLIDILNHENFERVSIFVDIHLEEMDDEWNIDLNTKLINAIFGHKIDQKDM